MATIALRSPKIDLASGALHTLGRVVELFEQGAQHHHRIRSGYVCLPSSISLWNLIQSLLQTLLSRLYTKALEVAAGSTLGVHDANQSQTAGQDELSLLGGHSMVLSKNSPHRPEFTYRQSSESKLPASNSWATKHFPDFPGAASTSDVMLDLGLIDGPETGYSALFDEGFNFDLEMNFDMGDYWVPQGQVLCHVKQQPQASSSNESDVMPTG